MKPDELADLVVNILKKGLDPIKQRLDAAEHALADESREGALVRQRADLLERQVESLTKDLMGARERLAGAEALVRVPGTPGPAGRDGSDGVGFDDMTVEHDGERTFVLRAVKGEKTKTLGTFTIPSVIYRGVYEEGRTYAKGDSVTWAGSLWVVNEETSTKPGEGSKAFTLAAKKGRDGRDWREGDKALPVVTRPGGAPFNAIQVADARR